MSLEVRRTLGGWVVVDTDAPDTVLDATDDPRTAVRLRRRIRSGQVS